MLEIEAADHRTTDRQYAFEMCLLPFTINIGDITLETDKCPNIHKLKLNIQLVRQVAQAVVSFPNPLTLSTSRSIGLAKLTTQAGGL